MRRGRIAMMLLTLFLVGQLALRQAGSGLRSVLGPAERWAVLAAGAYRVAAPGVLWPQVGGLPPLAARMQGGAIAVRPLAARPVTVIWRDPDLGLRRARLIRWQGPGLLLSGPGSSDPLPVNPRGTAALLATPDGLDLVALGRDGHDVRPLVGPTSSGLSRTRLGTRQHGEVGPPEGSPLVWAQAPTFTPDGREVLYFSNRTAPLGRDTLSLWEVRSDGRGDHLALDGEPYGSLSPVGWLGGRLLLAGADGALLAFDPATGQARTWFRLAEVVALAPRAGYMAVEVGRPGEGGVGDRLEIGRPDRLAPLALPEGARFAGLGAFSPGGRWFAFLALDGQARPALGWVRLVSGRPQGAVQLAQPPEGTVDLFAAPSFWDEDRVLVVTVRGRALTTWLVDLAPAWGEA